MDPYRKCFEGLKCRSKGLVEPLRHGMGPAIPHLRIMLKVLFDVVDFPIDCIKPEIELQHRE